MYNSPSFSSNYNTIIGIDWADQKHDLAIYSNGDVEQLIISNCPKTLHQYFLDLCEKNNWQKIAVVIEKNCNLIMHVLSSISLVDIYAIHPNTAASYRETFKPNGAKTDQIDSLSILDLFIKHPEKIQKYKPAQATDFLGQYCEKRRAIVDDRKAVGNQLTAALKKSFPVVLKIFKDTSIYGPIVLYFLKKWSNIASLKNASIQSIKNFFAKKSSKIDEPPKISEK